MRLLSQDPCPVPPPDFEQRDLPTIILDFSSMPLRRIHRSTHSPVHFNKPGVSRSRFRFDAPNDEFGVLYASQYFDACVTETIIRNRFAGRSLPLQIEEVEITTRSISMLSTTTRQLRLADLTQPLVHIGGNGQVLTDPDYAAPNLWSLAIQAHPAAVDGVLFISRYANKPSVAIFDRTPVIQIGLAVRLIDSAEMGGYLDRYDIALV